MFRRHQKSASRPKSSNNFRPVGEALESRLNLAGNVLAYAFGPNLYILGDNLDNELTITGNGKGVLSVAGVGGTRVNGSLVGTLNATGIVNIFAEMRSGNDTATFLDANINGLLRFSGSNGNDNLVIGNGGADFFGSVQALMGAGDDSLRVNDNHFTALHSFTAVNGEGNNSTDIDAVTLRLGVTSISGGSGSDHVEMGVEGATTGYISVNSGGGANEFFLDGGVTVNGGISVLGGSGPDVFATGGGNSGGFELTVNGSVTASLGDGSNVVEFASLDHEITGLISVVGGKHDDTFVFSNSAIFDALAISLTLGAGNNVVQMNQGLTIIRSTLTINTLGGLDSITGSGLDVRGSTSVSTGEGNDLIQLDNSRFRSVVTVLTAGGDDRVNVENGVENDGLGTRFDSVVLLYLGAGNDTLDVGFDANDFARFGSSVIVDGNLGADVLIPSPFNVFAFAPLLISIS